MNVPTDSNEIASLMDVFKEAKQRRRGRLPVRVLLVEDDPLTRRIVSHTFKEDYAVISACEGKEAIADYLMHAPDVVFLDIGLPGADGFAVLDQIISIDPDAFVVMFSSNAGTENVNRSFAAGAKGFIPKPFTKETLHNYIRGSAIHHRKSCI